MRIRYGVKWRILSLKMQGVGRTVKAAPVRIMTKIPEFMFANLVNIKLYTEGER
jgi:hypothetical protein